jgi:hypothetical protein
MPTFDLAGSQPYTGPDLLTPALSHYTIPVALVDPEVVSSAPEYADEFPHGMAGDNAPSGLNEILTRADAASSLTPSFGKVGKRGTSWTNGPCLDHLKRAALEKLEELRILAAAGNGLAIAEVDNLSKLTLQSGGYPGWHVMPHGYVRRLDTVRRDIVRLIVRALPSGEYTPGPIKRGTNKGGPSFGKSDEDMVANALIAHGCGNDPDAFAQQYWEITGDHGGPREPVGSTLFRKGPLAKHSPCWIWHGDKRAMVGTARGKAPRQRVVIGVFNASFYMSADLYIVLMAGLTRTQAVTATLSLEDIQRRIGAALRAAPDEGVFNDDISSFDQSVPAELQDAFEAEFIQRWPEHARAIRAWKQAERAPVVAPALRRPYDYVLYPSEGMTHSGNRNTATMGSLYNLYRAALCATEQNWNMNARQAVDWALFSGELTVLGDDTLLALKPARAASFSQERWQEASAHAGFTSKILPGPVFLRRWFKRDDTCHGLASRFVQQTAFNEHTPSTRLLELVGVGARALECADNPHFGWAWNALRSAPESPLEPFATADDLAGYLSTPLVRARIQAEASEKENAFSLSRMAYGEDISSPKARLLMQLTALVGRELYPGWKNTAPTIPRPQALTLARKIFDVTCSRAGVWKDKDYEGSTYQRVKALLQEGLPSKMDSSPHGEVPNQTN